MGENKRPFAPACGTRVAGNRSETRVQLVADQTLYLQPREPLARRRHAAALMAQARELLAQPPAIVKAEILAAKSRR
jgi:hypothetical protein